MPSLANAATNEPFGQTADIDVGTTTKGDTLTERHTNTCLYNASTIRLGQKDQSNWQKGCRQCKSCEEPEKNEASHLFGDNFPAYNYTQ